MIDLNPEQEGRPKPLLLNPRDAAQALAISPRKLWELTDTGEVSCVRIGRAVRYSVEDLRRWIRSQTKSVKAAEE